MCATARRFAKRTTTVIGRCSAVAAAALAATAHAQNPISLLEPAPGADAIAKKPEIRIAIATDYAPESLLVVVDGIDVTSLVERTSDGVRYRPLDVLPSGDHAITVHLRDRAGGETTAALQFSTRHSEKFDELASEVRLGVEVEDLAARRDSAAPRPSYHAEGETLHGLRLRRGGWSSALESNLWMLTQAMPVAAPPREGFELASLRWQNELRREQRALSAGFGDVQVTGLRHALATLGRRGANLGFDVRNFSLGAFSVSSRQLFGFTGGTGIGNDADENIYGFTTGAGFLDDKLRLRALHARGGEPGPSFGLYTPRNASRGEVTGYSLAATPWPALAIEAEYDESSFDADATDDVGARQDDAYSLRIGGQKQRFNYQLGYERFGPDYAVIASPVAFDQQNLAATGGIALARHSLSATALRQRDNVEDDPARARLGNREGALDYAFTANERWLVGASLRKSRVASSHEPAAEFAQEVLTSSVTARVQYARQPWTVGLELARSEQDDRLFDANDSVVTMQSLSPAYQTARFSVVPLASVSTTQFANGLELEQRNLSVMLSGRTQRERIGYGVALAYYDQTASDGSQAADTTSAELRFSYHFRKLEHRPPRATLSVRATTLTTTDRIVGAKLEDWTVWLTGSVSPRFAF